MQKLLIHGYVGECALQGITVDERIKERLLTSLRDYVENQLESNYEVFAHLGVAKESSIKVTIGGTAEAKLLAELRDLAERSIEEFKLSRLSEYADDHKNT